MRKIKPSWCHCSLQLQFISNTFAHFENSYYLSLASLRLAIPHKPIYMYISASQSHKTKQFASRTFPIFLQPLHGPPSTWAALGSLSLSLIPSQFIFMQQIAMRLPFTNRPRRGVLLVAYLPMPWGFAVICVLSFLVCFLFCVSCLLVKGKVSSSVVKLSNIFQHLNTNDKISRTLSSVFPRLAS